MLKMMLAVSTASVVASLPWLPPTSAGGAAHPLQPHSRTVVTITPQAPTWKLTSYCDGVRCMFRLTLPHRGIEAIVSNPGSIDRQ